MFELDFQGWYQVRLSTDPDATDEPRGVQGWTFAFEDEPPLDRVIRFQHPVAHRSHTPAVGVKTSAVRVNGQPVAAHPLLGAPVELLGNGVFEGRNGAISDPGYEPIVPFRLRFAQNGIAVEVHDDIDVNIPAEVTRVGGQGVEQAPPAFKQLAGIIGSPQAWRQSRLALVNADLAAATDPVKKHALQKRASELSLGQIRTGSLTFMVPYAFDVRGPHTVTDPHGALGAVAAGALIHVKFDSGCFDADALQAFIRGTLRVG